MASRSTLRAEPVAEKDEAIRPDQRATPEAGRPTRTEAQSTSRARLLVAALALLVLGFNLRTAITVVPPLLDRMSGLGLGPLQVSLLGALPAIAFSAAGWVGARLLRRYPAETIAVGVLVVTGAGQLARARAGDGWSFLALAAVTLLAMGVGNVIMPPLVKAWFPRRIALMTAAYVTCVTLGTAVPALLAVPVAAAAGWPAALTLWGVVSVLSLPLWAGPALRPRALPAPPASAVAHLPLYRSRVAWGLALLFGTNSLNIYSMIAWLPTRLVDAGASAAHAGFELALFTGVGVLPALLMPMLAVRVRRTELLIVGCVLSYLVGYGGLLWAPHTVTTLWVLLAGLGASGFPLALTLVGLRSESPAAAGRLSGFGQGIGYATAAGGPIVMGALHTSTGGWAAPFVFLSLTTLVMLAGAGLIAGGRTVEQDLARA